VKNRVASGEVNIQHCPTDEMIADYFTKPLQGDKFAKFCELIMNLDSNSPYHSSCRSVLSESQKTVTNEESVILENINITQNVSITQNNNHHQ
jgi:hypothetical protein